jgi:hypothetical protein
MNQLRELFLGNWRNKGVALFFAVTIWYVAFQSEKEECERVWRVNLVSTDENYIITKALVDRGLGSAEKLFSGEVSLTFSGPRKQIARVRDMVPKTLPLSIPLETTSYKFRPEDFSYPSEGVDIQSFEPQALLITQEPRQTVTIPNLAEKINVTDYMEGYEIVQKEVIPSSQKLTLTGPKSIVSRVGVSLNVSMGPWRERFQDEVIVTLSLPADVTDEGLLRTIRADPARVPVLVVVRAGQEAYPVDAIRVGFLLPPVSIPVKIVLDDVVGDTIPVEFFGRKDEINRLREFRLAQPGFALCVRVPAFDRLLGGQFTFAEDSLELFGFPGITIRQHESRRKDKKTGWSYTIVPVKEPEK